MVVVFRQIHSFATCEWTEGSRCVWGQGGRVRRPCRDPRVCSCWWARSSWDSKYVPWPSPSPAHGDRVPRAQPHPPSTPCSPFPGARSRPAPFAWLSPLTPMGCQRCLFSESHAPWGTGEVGPPSCPPLRVRTPGVWPPSSRRQMPCQTPSPRHLALAGLRVLCREWPGSVRGPSLVYDRPALSSGLQTSVVWGMEDAEKMWGARLCTGRHGSVCGLCRRLAASGLQKGQLQ